MDEVREKRKSGGSVISPSLSLIRLLLQSQARVIVSADDERSVVKRNVVNSEGANRLRNSCCMVGTVTVTLYSLPASGWP